jgi:hypothetical protein
MADWLLLWSNTLGSNKTHSLRIFQDRTSSTKIEAGTVWVVRLFVSQLCLCMFLEQDALGSWRSRSCLTSSFIVTSEMEGSSYDSILAYRLKCDERLSLNLEPFWNNGMFKLNRWSSCYIYHVIISCDWKGPNQIWRDHVANNRACPVFSHWNTLVWVRCITSLTLLLKKVQHTYKNSYTKGMNQAWPSHSLRSDEFWVVISFR